MSDVETMRRRLEQAWQASDRIFDLVPEAALDEQPIALRHPLLFYVGHLPAFASNQICRGVLGRPSHRPEFDELFERGIDPVGVDSHEAAVAWPSVAEVLEYRDRVRETVLAALDEVEQRAADDPLAAGGRIVSVVVEHELMHQETLLYMLQRLPPEAKRRPAGLPEPVLDGGRAQQEVAVPAGEARLGTTLDEAGFGWDNELPPQRRPVAAFRIDRLPVSNGDWLEFVDAGGYRRPELWQAEDWSWRERTGLEHPSCWQRRPDGGYHVLTMFDRLPLERAQAWPVSVSHAEARAYCRFRGRRLPTEAELHRAMYGDDGRSHPWGDAPPEAGVHGNFGLAHWAPTPVGSHPAGDSPFGLADTVGDGWGWTASPFRPFPGFEPWIRTYPGYSADFFDDRHAVMLGASWATPPGLIRRSFRNWFQHQYPYVFAQVRTVRG